MGERQGDDGLAVAVAVALLVGGVLIGRELLGLWPVVVVAYGVLLAVYCGPMLARRVADEALVRRFARRLKRAS
ncbi:hypothetical protein [Streptomyces sp. 058-1L]|uniref:hypothetical protein n=1 Tax=Streptomyces sp. 058-1L TaxID=2789266 RepID=UPI0039816E98